MMLGGMFAGHDQSGRDLSASMILNHEVYNLTYISFI